MLVMDKWKIIFFTLSCRRFVSQVSFCWPWKPFNRQINAFPLLLCADRDWLSLIDALLFVKKTRQSLKGGMSKLSLSLPSSGMHGYNRKWGRMAFRCCHVRTAIGSHLSMHITKYLCQHIYAHFHSFPYLLSVIGNHLKYFYRLWWAE